MVIGNIACISYRKLSIILSKKTFDSCIVCHIPYSLFNIYNFIIEQYVVCVWNKSLCLNRDGCFFSIFAFLYSYLYLQYKPVILNSYTYQTVTLSSRLRCKLFFYAEICIEIKKKNDSNK